MTTQQIAIAACLPFIALGAWYWALDGIAAWRRYVRRVNRRRVAAWTGHAGQFKDAHGYVAENGRGEHG